jgi:hypothetical protein
MLGMKACITPPGSCKIILRNRSSEIFLFSLILINLSLQIKKINRNFPVNQQVRSNSD